MEHIYYCSFSCANCDLNQGDLTSKPIIEGVCAIMNKRLFLGVLFFMIVSMLSVGLVSCGSDSDNEKESIDVDNVIGIWICTASHDSWDGGSEEGYMVNKYLIVNSDGT